MKDGTGDGFGAQFTKKKNTITEWKCKVCDVAVTSATQLEVHTQGTKHKKKLKTLGADIFTNAVEDGGELYDPEEAAEEEEEEEEAPTLHGKIILNFRKLTIQNYMLQLLEICCQCTERLVVITIARYVIYL